MIDDTETQLTDDETNGVALNDSDSVDRSAESFLEIESVIDDSTHEKIVWGQAVAVERIPATEVPKNYPVTVSTPEALSLRLQQLGTVDQEQVVYFEWDDGAGGDRLERLLALHEIPETEFAELYGQSIRLRAEDGHYVPSLPEQLPRGSESGAAIGGCLALLMCAMGFFIATGGAVSFGLVWLALSTGGLPLATYFDAWHCRTNTDWEGGPLFWTVLALIPVVNVITTLIYFQQRQAATALV